jgi:hypothetical protein
MQQQANTTQPIRATFKWLMDSSKATGFLGKDHKTEARGGGPAKARSSCTRVGLRIMCRHLDDVLGRGWDEHFAKGELKSKAVEPIPRGHNDSQPEIPNFVEHIQSQGLLLSDNQKVAFVAKLFDDDFFCTAPYICSISMKTPGGPIERIRADVKTWRAAGEPDHVELEAPQDVQIAELEAACIAKDVQIAELKAACIDKDTQIAELKAAVLASAISATDPSITVETIT